MSGWTPTSPLAKIVDLAGFSYDPAQDIIYSRLDALQRRFGYAYGYDASALLAIAANIDCEPIFFDYAGKHWMIELWKGQYGVETGCEVGIYNRPFDAPAYYAVLDAVVGRRPGDPNPAHNLFFNCADDADMLTMSYTLTRDGKQLFTRGPERHWWLTGFKWGVYSDPSELAMDIAIDMPDDGMREVFVATLTGMGYRVDVDGQMVTFQFSTPTTLQPRLNNPLRPMVEAEDKQIVETYQSFGLPNNDPNDIDDEIAARIEAFVAGKTTDFLGQAFATVFRDAGRSAEQIASLLADEFGMAASSVVGWITDAGYSLRDWVESLFVALKEKFGMDFSCAVEIDNLPYGDRLPSTLTRVDFGIEKRTIFNFECGHYLVEPPITIEPNRRARFYLQDNPGVEGAEGWARYAYQDASGVTRTATFKFGCPTGTDDNYARIDNGDFGVFARSGDDSSWHDHVPAKDHPLNVAFVWNHGPAPQ